MGKHKMAAIGENKATKYMRDKGPIQMDIVKRPLKERLIHMLAVRPYKKLEIVTKICNEGVKSARQKTLIATLLKTVSYWSNNMFHLQRHLWCDVREDWPFYTEHDRKMLRSRKPQMSTPPSSSDGESSTSSRSSTSTQNGSAHSVVKRPLLNREKSPSRDYPAGKKQRISHFHKAIVNGQDANITGKSRKMGSTLADKECSNATGDQALSQFTKITSVEQRYQYKTEFEKDYAEYMRLNAENEQISRRFAQLGAHLKNAEHNFQRQQQIEQQILEEYKQQEGKKKRLQNLHFRLSYIKQLVNEFDAMFQ